MDQSFGLPFVLGSPKWTIREPAGQFKLGHYPQEIIKDLKRKAWETIIDKINIRKVMSESKQRELEDQIKKGDFPDITEANILAMLETNYNKMSEYAEEMIREVYEWLRPRGYRMSEYKTNIKSESVGLGEKVILTYGLERQGWVREGKPWRISYSSAPKFTALDNVFHILDGKGIVKTHYGPLYDAVAATDNDGLCETEYFRLKLFKNCNMHLQFKRLDLLERFNQVAGGMRLRNSPHGVPA